MNRGNCRAYSNYQKLLKLEHQNNYVDEKENYSSHHILCKRSQPRTPLMPKMSNFPT